MIFREHHSLKKIISLPKKRGLDMEKLKTVIGLIADGQKLPQEYDEHLLIGNYNGCLECHIENDWLLVYKIDKTLMVLSLRRTGTHSDLF